MIHFYTPAMLYDKEKIYRRLQIRKDTPAYSYTENIFSSLHALAAEKMELFFCYKSIAPLPSFSASPLDLCGQWVLCLASCSDSINQVIQQKLEEGEYLEGYLLNDLANEILFNASNQMNRQIEKEMQEQGLRLTRRFSPGEPPMDLSYQKELLALFEEESDLPVTLNSHYMLKPEKSMLYLFGASADPVSHPVGCECETCDFPNCPYAVPGEALECSRKR